MATRIYQGVRNIEVEKSGGLTLSIPPYRCRFTFIGTDPITNLEEYDTIRISDLVTGEFVDDDSLKVQDSTGAFVGSTNLEVKAYLEGFIFLGDTLTKQQVGAIKENQELLLIQNNNIEKELEKLNLNIEELENIKKELKENNKILNKIYK